MTLFGRILVAMAVTGALGAASPGAGAAAQDPSPAEQEAPKRHFRVDRPATLSDAAALTVYLRILEDMAAGYRLSDEPGADSYRTWRRYNRTPYRSATHGERFVNNYANTKAGAYGRFEDFGAMPVGAILAKDSFAVTNRGDVFLGPLFIMEKMPAGFRAESRDWRYSMVMPDGSLFGATNGEGSARVEFCITCHKAVAEEHDQMFFVPEDYRVRIYSIEED